jgi:hypothetical protein
MMQVTSPESRQRSRSPNGATGGRHRTVLQPNRPADRRRSDPGRHGCGGDSLRGDLNAQAVRSRPRLGVVAASSSGRLP